MNEAPIAPDPATVAAIADWIEYSAGRVQGLSGGHRGLLAEYLRDGSWQTDRERKRGRETAARNRWYVAHIAGRPVTLDEVAAEVTIRQQDQRRQQERDDRDRRAMERDRAALERGQQEGAR